VISGFLNTYPQPGVLVTLQPIQDAVSPARKSVKADEYVKSIVPAHTRLSISLHYALLMHSYFLAHVTGMDLLARASRTASRARPGS